MFAHSPALLPSSRGSTGREKNDKLPPSAASRPNAFLRLSSSSKEQLLDNQAQEEQRREMLETVKQLTGGLESDRNSTEVEKSKAREAGELHRPSACGSWAVCAVTCPGWDSSELRHLPLVFKGKSKPAALKRTVAFH